jgi:hypothetical protein
MRALEDRDLRQSINEQPDFTTEVLFRSGKIRIILWSGAMSLVPDWHMFSAQCWRLKRATLGGRGESRSLSYSLLSPLFTSTALVSQSVLNGLRFTS